MKQEPTKADIINEFSGSRPLYDNAAANASDVTCDYTFDADAGGPDTRPLPMLGIFGGEMPGTGFDAYLAALRHRRFWLPAPVARRYEGLAQHDQ